MASTTATPSTSATAGLLTLHFKPLRGREFSLIVPPQMLVSELQQRIASKEGIPIPRQRLIYQGKVLKPDQPLSFYNVEDGDALHLIIRAEDAPPPAPPEPTPNPTSAPSLPQAGGFSPFPFPPFAGPMMMANVNVAPGSPMPDLNQLLSNVLGQVGMAMQQVQQQQPQQPQPQPQAQAAANSSAQSAAQPPPDASSSEGPPAVGSASAPAAAVATAAGGTTAPQGPQQPPGQPLPQQGQPPPQPQPGQQGPAFMFSPFPGPPPPFAQFPNGAPLPAGAAPFLFNNAREAINSAASAAVVLPSPTSPSSSSPSTPPIVLPGVRTTPFPDNIEGLSELLRQLNEVLTELPPAVSFVVDGLQSQAAASTTPTARNSIQHDAHQLGLHLRRLGNGLVAVGRLLSHVAQQTPSSDAPLAIAPNPVHPATGPVERRSTGPWSQAALDQAIAGQLTDAQGHLLPPPRVPFGPPLPPHMAAVAQAQTQPVPFPAGGPFPPGSQIFMGPTIQFRPAPGAGPQAPGGPPQPGQAGQPMGPQPMFTFGGWQRSPPGAAQPPGGTQSMPSTASASGGSATGPSGAAASVSSPGPSPSAPSPGAAPSGQQQWSGPQVQLPPGWMVNPFGQIVPAAAFGFAAPTGPNGLPVPIPMTVNPFAPAPQPATTAPSGAGAAPAIAPSPSSASPPSTSAPLAAAAPPAAVTGAAPVDAMAMLGQIFQGLSQTMAAQQSAASPAPPAVDGSQPQPALAAAPANPFAGLMQMVGPLLQQLAPAVQQATGQQQPTGSAPAGGAGPAATGNAQAQPQLGAMIAGLVNTAAGYTAANAQRGGAAGMTGAAPSASAGVAPPASAPVVDQPTAASSSPPPLSMPTPPAETSTAAAPSAASSSSVPFPSSSSSAPSSSSSSSLSLTVSSSSASSSSSSSSSSSTSLTSSSPTSSVSSAPPSSSSLGGVNGQADPSSVRMSELVAELMRSGRGPTTPSSSSSTGPTAPPSSSSASPPTNMSTMMSSMMQALMQASNRQPGAAAPSIQDVMRPMLNPTSISSPLPPSASSSPAQPNADADDDDDLTVVDMLMDIVTQRLSLPDMLVVLNGDFSPFDRTEADFYDIIVQLLDEQDSEAIRMSAAEFHAQSILTAFFSPDVLATRAPFVRDQRDVVRRAMPVMERHLRTLIDTLLARHDLRQSNPAAQLTPFSHFFKAWGTELIGSLMDAMVQCYTDGLTSVSLIMQQSVLQRLASAGDMGFMAPMVSGTLKAGMVKVYEQWKQRQTVRQADGTGAEAWLERVPANERPLWRRTVEQDEKRMAEQLRQQRERRQMERDGVEVEEDEKEGKSATLFRPLSYAYLSGSGRGVKRVKPVQEGHVGPEGASEGGRGEGETETKDDGRFALGESLEPTLRRALEKVERGREAKNGSSEADGEGEELKAGESRVDVVMRAAAADPALKAGYRGQWLRDLKRKVEQDEDFESHKFPMTERHVRQQR